MKKILVTAISISLVFVSFISNASIFENSKYETRECPKEINREPSDISGKFKSIRLRRFTVECMYENKKGVIFQGYAFMDPYEEYFRLEGVAYKPDGVDFNCESNSYNPSECKFKSKRVDSK